MKDITLGILASVVTSGAATGTLVFLTKAWISERLKGSISHEYNTKLESFRSQLKSENDTNLERFKAELAVQNTEHLERVRADLQIEHAKRDVQFRHLHAKMAKVIAEVYGNLQTLRHAVIQYTKELELRHDLPREQRLEAVNTALAQFNDQFVPNQIYLTQDLAARVREVHQKMFEAARRFRLQVDASGGENTGAWCEIAKSIQQELPQLFNALELEFRKHLGYDTLLAESTALAPAALGTG